MEEGTERSEGTPSPAAEQSEAKGRGTPTLIFLKDEAEGSEQSERTPSPEQSEGEGDTASAFLRSEQSEPQ